MDSIKKDNKMNFNLDAIAIEVTRRCNLNCRYCFTGIEDKKIFEEKIKEELTTIEIKNVLQQAKALKISGITWTGGEFFIREDALELLEYASNLNFVNHIVTNSTFLNREFLCQIKKITKNRLFFSFSINSLEEKENVWSRDDAPTTAFKAMDLCDELDISYTIILTDGKFNLDSIENTIKYFQEKKILVIRSPLVPRGKGKSYFKKYGITKKDMEKIINPIFRENSVTYISYTPIFVSPDLIKKEKMSLGMLTPGCYIGKGLVISAEGDVGLCPNTVDVLKIGNIRNKSLYEITNSKKFLTLIDRNNLKGKCGRCRYKYSCGGCRGMAYYHTGDYFAEDPLCFFEPQDENQKSEYEEICTQKYFSFLNLNSSVHILFVSIILGNIFPFPPNILRKFSYLLVNHIGLKNLRKIFYFHLFSVKKLLL